MGHKLATRIQCAARGRAARKVAAQRRRAIANKEKLKRFIRWANEHEDDIPVNRAAARIQGLYRGKIARGIAKRLRRIKRRKA